MHLMASLHKPLEADIIHKGTTYCLTTERVQALMHRLLQTRKCRQTGRGGGRERGGGGGGEGGGGGGGWANERQQGSAS